MKVGKANFYSPGIDNEFNRASFDIMIFSRHHAIVL